MLASIAGNVLLFAMPLYSLQIYDRVLASRSGETLLFLTLIAIVALIVAATIDAIRARLLQRIGNAYVLALGPRLLEHSLAQSARGPETSSQPLRDMHTVRGFIATPQGLAALFDAPLVPLFLLGVYLMHVGLGHAMLAGIVVLVCLAFATEALTAPHVRRAGEAAIGAQRRLDGIIHNAEVVAAMGMGDAMREHWSAAQGMALAEGSIAGDRLALLAAVAKGVRMLLTLMMSGIGAWYAIHDEITMGGMVAATIIAARGLAPLEMLVSTWKQWVGVRAAVLRLDTALSVFPCDESTMSLPEPQGDIVVERLIFAPAGVEQPTLKGISFTLPAGSWMGVIGPSGAGKSTLAKLLCGVWKPRSGSVRLDGADVYTWNRADFGRYCGYLPQDIELFSGTVRENIARFSEADDAKVIEAAQAADCHEMILRLPKAYDTQIGPGGAALSAGQRQRIGLARALFGRPRLVVLDEPNSNLDAEGEQALVRALQRTRANGATVIMISHRPSLLSGCDKLGVLMDGQLQHFGPREEVLAKLQGSVRTIGEARSGAA